jgi:hypothetical protein
MHMARRLYTDEIIGLQILAEKSFLALTSALNKCRHFCSSQQIEEDKHHSEHHSWEKIMCHFAKHHGTSTSNIAPAEHHALGCVMGTL